MELSSLEGGGGAWKSLNSGFSRAAFVLPNSCALNRRLVSLSFNLHFELSANIGERCGNLGFYGKGYDEGEWKKSRMVID